MLSLIQISAIWYKTLRYDIFNKTKKYKQEYLFQIINDFVNSEHIALLKPKSMFTELRKKTKSK